MRENARGCFPSDWLSCPDVAQRSPLVLVADDAPANLELLCDQLAALGYRTVTARDGPTALALTFAERPDLCILDVAMPIGSLGTDDQTTGFEICRRIKRDPRTKSIPVIFVAGLDDAKDRIHAIEAGGDDFLTKPHNRQVLGARVRALLKYKAASDALEEALRAQRELGKTRDDLMKMIVHDLKTPLTSVLATLEMVLDGDFGALGESQRKALVEVEGQAEDLLALIGDLLAVTQVEQSHISITPEPIAPAAFLAEQLFDWQHRFQQEGATAETDVNDDAPIFHADKTLLKRVFANLLQNALTHSPHGVHVRMSARADGEGILFTVADNGPGIPREYHELIFRKFQQVRTANAPKTRSSGLGLTFCRLAVEGHGGRIWAQSEEGRGAAFHIWLPLAAAPV
jgi:two-component system sensor histidine kinase/response regulator